MIAHVSASRAHPLAAELVASVGEANVFQDEQVLTALSHDRSPFPGIDPGIVVTPRDVDDIAGVLRIANRSRNSVIVRGAGFSMTGFLQRAPREAIILDTRRRLSRVLDIDDVNMTVTAEAGVIMSDLEAKVADRGFEVQTVGVPKAQTTLGGVLSGVIGGGLPRDSSLGTTGRQVIGLKVVLADGTVVETNARGGNVHRSASAIPGGDGPFLTDVFIGDGGSFGVKVEATLQIAPLAAEVSSGEYVFNDFDAVWKALGALAAIRETPYSGIGVAEGPPWRLSFTTRASSAELLREHVRRVERVLTDCGGRPESPAASAIPSRDWFVNAERAILSFIFARAQFVQALAQVRGLLERRIRERRLADLGIALKVYFYAHTRHAIFTSISILFDPVVPEGRAKAVELAVEGYELVVALGGHLEPHQGAASRIIAASWSPSYRRFFTAIKAAVDPNHILNPGLWGID